MRPTSIVVDGPVCIGNWCPHNYSGGYGGSMTLIDALRRPLNTLAGQLFLTLGKGNAQGGPAKGGRAAIGKTARAMGLRTVLRGTPSLSIGVYAVTSGLRALSACNFPNL